MEDPWHDKLKLLMKWGQAVRAGGIHKVQFHSESDTAANEEHEDEVPLQEANEVLSGFIGTAVTMMRHEPEMNILLGKRYHSADDLYCDMTKDFKKYELVVVARRR